MNREAVIEELAGTIAGIRRSHPVRVGLDGVDASGKTMLADELVGPLKGRGRSVIRVSIDRFHNPRAIRYRQGPTSPRGYYEDSFDHAQIIASVLAPLGPDGDRRYRSGIFDFRTDAPAVAEWQTAAPDAILLFDGVFLHRRELRPYWDYSIFVHAGFEVTLSRAEQRDLPLLGSSAKVRDMYRQRYIPGQRIYLEAENPAERADVVFDNTDLERPVLKRNRPDPARGCRAERAAVSEDFPCDGRPT